MLFEENPLRFDRDLLVSLFFPWSAPSTIFHTLALAVETPLSRVNHSLVRMLWGGLEFCRIGAGGNMKGEIFL